MPRVIGFASTLREIVDLIARRRYELGLRQLEVDDLAGLQSGWTSKCECATKRYGDMSLSCTLGALGLKIAIVEDEAGLPQATQRFLDELPERRPSRPVGPRIGRAARDGAPDAPALAEIPAAA